MELGAKLHFRHMIGSLLRSGAGQLLRLFYPPVCAGCGRMAAAPAALCAECWGTVRFVERPFCDISGAPFDHDRGEGLLSPEAIANPPPYAKARAAVLYDGAARKLAQGLKYSDRADLAKDDGGVDGARRA
jgi:predicted amidophosphoribosyltransferase